MWHWTKDYSLNYEKCLVQNNKAQLDDGRALKLKDFSSAFLFWALGLSLAFLVFLIEKIIFYYKEIQKQRNVDVNHGWRLHCCKTKVKHDLTKLNCCKTKK